MHITTLASSMHIIIKETVHVASRTIGEELPSQLRLQVNTTMPLVLKITLSNGYLDKTKRMSRGGCYMPEESVYA